MGTVRTQSTRLDLSDDVEEVYAYFEANGDGDGRAPGADDQRHRERQVLTLETAGESTAREAEA